MNEEIILFNYFSTTPLKLIAAILLLGLITFLFYLWHKRQERIESLREYARQLDMLMHHHRVIDKTQHTDS